MSDMQINKIERLGKQLHQFAEEYEYACKAGSGFEASEVIGKIVQITPQLRETAWAAHGSVQPYNNQNQGELLPPGAKDIDVDAWQLGVDVQE